MEVSFDPAKRERTLRLRGLDFQDAGALFERPQITVEDGRYTSTEVRFQTFGWLRGRLVMIA